MGRSLVGDPVYDQQGQRPLADDVAERGRDGGGAAVLERAPARDEPAMLLLVSVAAGHPPVAGAFAEAARRDGRGLQLVVEAPTVQHHQGPGSLLTAALDGRAPHLAQDAHAGEDAGEQKWMAV